MVRNKFDSLTPCKENKISIYNYNPKPNMVYSKENNFIIENDININDKEKLINDINNINIDSFDNKNDLKDLENNLESLLNNIRIKLGYKSENSNLENILGSFCGSFIFRSS